MRGSSSKEFFQPPKYAITNRKSLMRFRLIPRSMTLDDHDLLKVQILGISRNSADLGADCG